MDVSQKPDSANAPSSIPQRPIQVKDPDEISLIDILKFLRRQYWVIGSTTLVTIAIGVGASLLASSQARRELLLSLTLPPELSLNSTIATNEPAIYGEILEAGSLAMINDFPGAVIQQGDSSPVSATLSTATEVNPERLRLVLTSEEPAILESAEQPALDTLQKVADEVTNSYITPEITRLDLLTQRTQEKIALLENRLATSATLPSGDSVDFSTFLQFQQQAQQQSLIAQEFNELVDHEQERASLSDLQVRDEPLVSIEILADVQTQESSSLLRRLILSAIAGFMLGILIALIVDQLPRLKAALTHIDDE